MMELFFLLISNNILKYLDSVTDVHDFSSSPFVILRYKLYKEIKKTTSDEM